MVSSVIEIEEARSPSQADLPCICVGSLLNRRQSLSWTRCRGFEDTRSVHTAIRAGYRRLEGRVYEMRLANKFAMDANTLDPAKVGYAPYDQVSGRCRPTLAIRDFKGPAPA